MLEEWRRSRFFSCVALLLLSPESQGYLSKSFNNGAIISSRQRNYNGHHNSKVVVREQAERSDAGSVPITPCTRICRYNSNVFDGQVCIGCFRETCEIAHWQSMTPIEKYYALLDASDPLDEATGEGAALDSETTGTSKEELMRQAEYWKGEGTK